MRLWSSIVIVLCVAGCSGWIQRRAGESTYQLVASSGNVAKRQPDVELARAAMPGGVIQMAAFAAAYPDQPGFRVMYADAICQYAIGFVLDDWDAATLAGRTAEADNLARRLDLLIPQCLDANLARLAPSRRATARTDLAHATVAEVPVLLSIAQADAVALALSPLAHLAELPAITALLERCATLAPGSRDASAELLLAVLAGSRPSIAGGDGGEAEFARARKLAGDGVLMVDVLAARTGAVTRKDRAAFEKLLNGVLAADPTRWPDRRLINELARAKARRYLAAIDTLFPPS